MNDLKKVFDQTVRELKREVSKKVLRVPEIETKVLEATSNEPWGPHGALMADIAEATYTDNELHMIMPILWKRLRDTGKNWRHVYKGLIVLEFLLANGAPEVIDEMRDHHVFQIQPLTKFYYIEQPSGKDFGMNVRRKAESLLVLLNDKHKIAEARCKASATKDKFLGISSTGRSFKRHSTSSIGNSRESNDQDDQRDTYSKGSSCYRGDEYLSDQNFGRYSTNRNLQDNPLQVNEQNCFSNECNYIPRNVSSLSSRTIDDFDDFDPRASSSSPASSVRAFPVNFARFDELCTATSSNSIAKEANQERLKNLFAVKPFVNRSSSSVASETPPSALLMQEEVDCEFDNFSPVPLENDRGDASGSSSVGLSSCVSQLQQQGSLHTKSLSSLPPDVPLNPKFASLNIARPRP
ncbi:hypothetical protein O6H91_20G068000 [Diphasiastrum complanatum]|uniref:Uncharacterized protein n=1 Tax=Diphasiastrum complanatum TaxID=34168 RepID=A0ACC2ARG7_DIPCM|nr:hypothetical protein O6H91_20G068000 [Diphasiastrum complanatum]